MFGKMICNYFSYVTSLPTELERRLREASDDETLLLKRDAYLFWANIKQTCLLESPNVKLFIESVGQLQFNVLVIAYNDAGEPETTREGAMIILNETEAQLLTKPLPKPVRGRPPLTEKDQQERDAIVSKVEETKRRLGITYEQACAREGVPYSTFRDWRRRKAR